MHMRIALLAGCMATAALPGQAAASGLGFKLGTLGLGAEYEQPLGENVSGRLGFNAFNYSDDFSTDDNDYDGDLKLRSISALLDWYPTSSGFHLTAGALYNGNKVDLTSTGSGQVSLGDTLYDVDGEVTGTADFRKFAPYLGLGWNHSFGAHERWSIAFDLGVMFQGSPKVRLAGEGTFTDVGTGLTVPVDDALFQDDLRREEAQLEDDLEDFKYYPVIALTLVYRF